MSRLFLSILVLLCPWFAARGADAGKVQIDPYEVRAAIRAELLKYTPLGSSTKEVLNFVRTQLQHEGDEVPQVENHPATGELAAKSDRKGVKVIKVDLADYLSSPILLTLVVPMPLRSFLTAQWAFDKDGKLIEIFLDREAQPEQK